MKITMKHTKKVGLILGPALFLAVLFFPTILPEELSFEARIVLGATLWMAVWWITEAIPIYVTALLPFIIFPSLGVTELQETAASYADRIIFLFLGGFMLANAFIATGLDDFVADRLIFLEGMNYAITILIIVAVTAVVGEVISNTATAALMIPISASLATSLDVNPILFMVPVTIVTSYSFMMPVSTPPNTIVFASGYVTTSSMVRAGLPLKVIGIAIVTVLTILLVPLVWQ
jgi:sodium-dependent dicarboxylate transporter 2/3/5